MDNTVLCLCIQDKGRGVREGVVSLPVRGDVGEGLDDGPPPAALTHLVHPGHTQGSSRGGTERAHLVHPGTQPREKLSRDRQPPGSGVCSTLGTSPQAQPYDRACTSSTPFTHIGSVLGTVLSEHQCTKEHKHTSRSSAQVQTETAFLRQWVSASVDLPELRAPAAR